VADLPPEIPADFLRPLVAGWVGKLEAADRSRSRWKEVAEECQMFYSRSAAAMWDTTYSRKFWRGIEAPRFRITINLAYEYVAVFGPNLFWETPHRNVTPKRPIPIPPEVFQGLGQEPMLQQLQQQFQETQDQQYATDRVVSHLMQDWLNYTAKEQPGGGLSQHSELAILDALIKGRGCLQVKPFKFPGSGRQLTGCFYLPPENLLIDPDFRSLQDAKWIAIKHIEPHWEVERRFRLNEGSLKSRSSLESSWSYGEGMGSTDMSTGRASGQTNDLLVWWEVWSKTGVGARLTGMHSGIKDHMQDVVGDFAYLAISPAVPFPLNCPAEELRKGLPDEKVRQNFMWPIPLWTDDRWPVEVIDFYPNTDQNDPSAAWPIPPLSPALGEIKFLNFIIPWLTNRVWSSSRDFWAVSGAYHDELQKYLQEGSDQTIIPVPHALGGDISKAVTILKQPETRADVWRIVDLVTDLFRRRTGLVDFAYGKNEGGTQSRTAEDTREKARAVGTRPEHMQKKVVQWQSQVAGSEAFVTRLFITGEDVEDRYGPIGRLLWEQFIMSTNVELVVRQMQYSISASSIRRPNRDRDLANLMQVFQHWMSLIQQYGSQTGDYTPANGIMEMWGEMHDQDMEKVFIPPPQEDEQQQQMQQQQMQMEQMKMQMEMEKGQTEIEKAKIELQGKMIDAQVKQATGGIDVAGKQMELQFDQSKGEQEMAQDQMRHLLDMLQDRQKFNLDFTQQKAMNKLKRKQTTNGNGS